MEKLSPAAASKVGKPLQISDSVRITSAKDDQDKPSVQPPNASDSTPVTDSDYHEIKLEVPSPGDEVQQVWLGQVLCMFCSAPYHCCCTTVPSMKESTSTRFMYLIMCGLCISMALISLVGGIPVTFGSLAEAFNTTCTSFLHTLPGCHGLFGTYAAVYKACTGQLSLHIILIPLTIGIKNSLSKRALIHNGFWFWKYMWIIVITCAVFLIPDQSILGWFVALRYLGMIGGGLFILADIFFICEMVISMNNLLLDKAAVRNIWYVVIWGLTLAFMTAFILLCVLLTKYYTLCDENKAIVILNIVASIILILLTVIPGLGKGSFNVDLLPASIIVTYILVQTWLALHNRPDGKFNKEILAQILAHVTDIKELVAGTTTIFPTSTVATAKANLSFLTSSYSNATETNTTSSLFETITIANMTQEPPVICHTHFFEGPGIYIKLQYAGLAYYMFVALYKSITNTLSHAATMKRYTIKARKTVEDANISNPQETMPENRNCCVQCCRRRPIFLNSQKIIYNETDATVYNYCFMHLQFCCSILFVMMTLTNWFSLESDLELSQWTPNWASFWVQIITTWCTMVVYILTLFLPLHCQDNPFYQKVVDSNIISEPRKSIAFSNSRPLLGFNARTQFEQKSETSSGGLTYFDRNGVPVTDTSNHYGVLYTYDKYGRLLPVKDNEVAEKPFPQSSYNHPGIQESKTPALALPPTEPTVQVAHTPSGAPQVPKNSDRQREIIVINNTTEKSPSPLHIPTINPLFISPYPQYLPPPLPPHTSPSPVPASAAPTSSPFPVPAVATPVPAIPATSDHQAKETVVKEKRRKRKRRWRLPYLVHRTRKR